MVTESRQQKIVSRLHELRDEIEAEITHLLKEERVAFKYTLKQSRVRFDEGIKKLHKRQRISSLRYLLSANIKHVISAPVILSLIVPLALLDLWVTLYQMICFPLYGIPRVDRSHYLVLDRHHLSYLNTIEKLNCLYCGYGNGVLDFAREVASQTEQYWCPIKHARRSAGQNLRQSKFSSYGDADNYRDQLARFREELQQSEISETAKES